MSHKIKIYIISLGLMLFGFVQLSILGPSVFAIGPNQNPTTPTTPQSSVDKGPAQCNDTSGPNGGATNASIAACLKHNKIVVDLNKIVNFLSAAVGIAIVGALIVGGIQYSMASGNSGSTQAARKRLTDAVIALFAFIFVFAFLQWLIPGGL